MDNTAQESRAAQQGEVLLVSCYELGHQPLGLALPAAFLHRAGLPATLVDLAVDHLSDARIDAARFIGISVPMHTALQLGRRLARRIRARRPGCTIAFFGHYAHLHADMLLQQEADLVLGGECEADLVRAVQHCLAGETAPRQETVLQRLRFPVPRRVGLPDAGAYARLQRDDRHVRSGTLETTRGCRHRCRHCPIPAVYDGRLFAVPKSVVLEDAREQIAAGVGHLSFADADFLNAPGQGIPILRALHDAFPEVTFDFTARIQHLVRHAPRMPELGACGVLFVVSAVETLNDDILAILDKGHRREDVLRAHGILRDCGIALRPSLMPFTPWTRGQDVADILRWVADADLVDSVDAVQYSIRLLLPRGSLLLQHPAMRPHLGTWDAEALTYSWKHADPSLDALQRDLAALAATAAANQEEPEETFRRIVDRVFAPPGDAAAAARPPRPVRRRRQRPPRMTEPWFC